MPIFELDGKKYDVEDRHLDSFATKYPEAYTVGEKDGKKWKVRAKNYTRFLGSSDKPEEPKQDDTLGSESVGINVSTQQSSMPKITKDNIGSMGFVQDEASALYPMSSTRLQPITSLDGKLRGTEQAEKEFNQAMEEKEIDEYFVPKQMNTADDVYENFATRFTNTQEGVTLNEDIAKKTKEVQDKYLKDYMSSKEFAELSKQYKGEEFQKKANEQFQFMYGDKIENELKPINENYGKAINARYGKQINDELSRIAKNDASTELTRISKSTDEALDSVEEQIKKRRRQLRNDNWKPGHPMDVARNDNMLSELNVERSYLSTAQNLNDDSMKILEAAKKEKDGTFIGGLGRGVSDSVFDIDTWTMGITGMVDEMRLNNVLTKSEKGEKLTDAEKNLLDACVNNMAINHYYGSDLGYGYQAGKITGESLPFMLEFLINPVSASGKTLAKRILTWGLKNNIKGMSTKGAKMAARFLGDAIAAGGVTLSTGAGMVGEGTIERLNRNFEFNNDDKGNLVVTNTGEISTGEAFGKSLTSAFLERQSEMIFNAFRPLKGKPVNTLAERMQWHGLAEEQLEEVYNNFMNIPLGEMTLEEATSLEQNLITFLGLAPTQVAFSAVGGVGYAVERYNAKKKIREAYGALTPEQQDKLKKLEELAKDHRNRDIAIFLSETLKDESLTQEQKRAELEYAYNLVVNNAIEEAEEAETQSRVEADNASIDAATDTQTGNYAQVTAILSDGLGGTKEVVGNVVGWIGGSPMFVPDGMEVTEENKIPLQPGQWNPETLIERPAEEVKAINEEIVREEVVAQAERESKYAPEVLSRKMEQGIPFETADAIYLPIQPMAEGNGWTVEVQPKATNNKTASKSEVIELTNDEFYDLLQADLEAQEALQAEIAQSESVGEQVNAPVNTEVNNPMEPQGSTPMSPMSEEFQSATEEKSTQPVIPTKEDGSIDFVAYGREGTLKTLGEKYGEKLPNKVAVTAKALAEDVVKAEEKLAKAEEAYDNAPIGRERKAEQARDKARQELEEVKKEAEYWKAIDEEIKEAQKAREAIVNPAVEADMSNEPMTTEEFVAKALADGGIRLTSDSYKKEMGYGEKERKRFPKMFAKKENGGLSIEEAGEWLMQWDSENGTNFFDQEDANAGRDALINFLGSVRTWGDITGYIRRNREQLAERESEGLRNEVENAIESNYHMTPEEYATLQEVESVENPFGGLDVATKDAIFVEAYEEYEQSLNPKQNDEGRTSEIAEGNGVVLPEERTDNEGGTSERQGERPDLSEGAVQQNDAAQEAEQVEEPLTIQEGESPVAFAERVVEEQRRKPLRNRANEWAKALGVKVHFIERLEDVENQAAYLALSNGSKVAGWYEGATGEVFLYMPNLDNIAEVDKTYIHEVVAHKGLREMLGRERFNELCDKVWDMMPDKEKAEFIQYEGVNGDTRAAADEYIAYLAEKENLTPEEKTRWDSIVKMFRDMLDRALNGIIGKSKLTDKDISDLIKASYANLKSGAEGGVGGDGTRFRTLEQINSEFNENLQKQIEGALPKGYIYQLGSPSAVLRSAGIEDLPIELAASRLVDKSMQDNHPFELSEVENLPEAIHNPLAVFVSATRVGSNVILTELKHGGKNFVAVLRVRPNKNRIEVNQIRSLYPKNTNGIIDWINNGLATYVDKERMVEWVEKQRNELLSKPQSNSVEVREQLVSATKIVNDFENPTLPEEKSLFRVVYHGSAASFGKFNKDFIGSGEGNSVAGYGFYVTSDDSVGKYYADFSSKNKRKVVQSEGYTVNGELVKDSALVNAYNLLKENEFDVEKSISYVEERIEQKKKEPKKGIFGSTKLYENMLVYLQKEQDNPGTLGYQEEVIEQPGRYLYEVEIPDDNGKNYLDLDKSVPKNVKEKAKEKLLEYLYNGEDAEYWENNKSIIEEQWKLVEKKGATAETLRSTMQEIVGREEVSDIFSSMGYIGFKTSEDSERGTTYVVFDESNLNIVNHTRFRVKGISGLKPSEVADKIKDCFYEDVAKSDRIAMVEYLQQSETGKAVIDRMYQHNGTGWARQTANATFVRIALNDLIEGREPSVQSMLTRGREHPVVKYIKQLGKEGVWRYIQTFGLLGEAGKPVNNVNGSFLSCNPSNECAKYCYATKGNYIYAGSSVKSELVYWCIANDPIRAAQRIVDEYKSKPQYYEGKALRLFDKGDIDMAWIPVIEELNKQGVVTQVFSKRPEILERVDKGLNVVMMSIDSSNSDMLDEYPTMPVALVYRGNVDSELLEKCKDRLQQYGGVILPVKIGQKLLSENEVKSLPLWTRPYQCPIDNGKRQINDKENPERSWNCTKCDKNGGVGCFFHRTANKLRNDRYENETKSTSGRTERDNQRSSSRNAESSNGGSVPLHSTNGAVGDIEFRRELLRTLRESLAEGGLSDADITPKLLETLDRRLRGMLEGRGTQSSSSTLSTNSLEESREIGQGYERGDRPESDSRIKSEGGTRFRISNQNQEIFAHESAIDYVSQANDVVEVPREEVMYTMNNIASQLYKTSGRFMRQLYQNGTLGRVLKGDYAEIDQIKAKNEYDHAKPILDEYLNELVWMKYQATDAAQEVINDVISDVEYAIKYYKDLSLGKDVWRTEERPRFRIVEKQREDVNKGVDSFTSKYNSKPVSVASSEMTDEELEKAVPTSLVEDTRKAIEEGVKGKYSVKADKIYIFADNVTKEELEDTLFHENLHPMFSGNPLIEEFYANFNAKYPEQVKMLAEGYEESEVPEEVFVTNLAVGMQRGNFKMVEPFLAESSREDLYNTLKAFGYDYEQERGRRNPERNSGKGSDVAEGKKVANRSRGKEDSEGQRESSREQAEKLRDLFGRVADMGLDGVLGNEAYDRAMMDIYSVLPEDSRKEVIDDAFNHYGMNIAPAVSDYIHGKSDGNILDKIVAIIRNALRKVGFDIDLNGNEVKYLAWRSKKPLDRSNLVDIAEDIYKKYQLKVGEYSTNDDGTTPDGGGTRFRRVYHGTGASFDKFDHSFMGTGEGAQAFGWGTYVTEVKGIGKDYARKLATDSNSVNYIGEFANYVGDDVIRIAKSYLIDSKYNLDRAKEHVRRDLKLYAPPLTRKGGEFLLSTSEEDWFIPKGNRHLYEVEIPDNDGSNYIEWDEVISEEELNGILNKLADVKDTNFDIDYFSDKVEEFTNEYNLTGRWLYELLSKYGFDNKPKNASKALEEIGYIGIEYPANALSGGRSDGAKNYVIFNEKDLEIKEHTRFKVKETKKERIADLRAEISDLKREVTNARKNSQEEWEANQRAIISFIKGKLTKEAGEEFGKYRIDQLLNLVNKATTAKDLRKPFQFIEQVINSAIMDREAARMEKLIKTKLQGETSRGVAKGVVVDESTRRLFDSIRGTFKDLISTSIDSELRHVRSEILRFGKEINDLPKDDIQGRTILTAQQEALKERRKELEAEQEELRKNNVVETKESLKKRYDELVDAMDAHIDGNGAWTIEMQDEYDSIPLREKLAEIREAQAQLDDILTDALNTRRAAYGLKGGERKKMLAEADILDSNYSIAQEELIRLMSEVSRDLEEIIKEGKSRLASRREALDERRRKIVSMGIGAVKDRKVIAPNAALTKEEKWHKWFDNSGLKKFSDFMTAPLNSFNFLLKYIDRNHTIGEGELYNYFMKSQEGALEANNRLYDGLKAYNTAIEEKAKEIFGKSIEKVMKDSGKEYNDRVTKQYMFDSTSHREGERYPIRISKGQALYVWLTWRQEDGRAKLLADGWTEESIAEIEDLIGGDYMKFGEWITDEFFPQLREEKYNKTHIEMFGTSMAKREHYFPFKVNAEDIQEKGEMGESYEGMPSTITGNIIKRTINKSRINTEQNAFDLLYKYGNDMETWNAMAKLRQDLNFLHASKAFRNYMEANSKGLFNTFMKAAEVAVKAYNNTEKDAINDFFAKLNRTWAGTNIGFRLNTAMKQILSYPAFMAYSGNLKYQGYLMKNAAKELWWDYSYRWALENLPAFRNRVESGDMGMTGMTDPSFNLGKVINKFGEWGMIPNQLVDAFTCAIGAKSVYDFEYNRAVKAGMSEEEAKNIAQYNAEVAFNETQQSSRDEFVSPTQVSRNVLIKSMMNYQNSNVGYQRMGNEGLLEIMRAKHVYEQDLKNGMNEAEAKKKMANSIARGTRKVMVAFTILPGLWYLGGRGIVGITAPLISSLFGGGGDDEPYLDDEAKKDLMLSIALGTVAGTSGGQTIASVVQGREYEPMAYVKEFTKIISDAVKDGFNLNATKNIALKLAKFGGVNVETFENIYLGVEHAIRTGNFDLVDFMFLINLPPSQRKAMAEELYSDMPFMEYADKVSRAQKLFDDYRKNLPYAKSDKNGSKKNAIKKQYIIENLSEEKQDKLEKEKEFKKLQREYGQAEDKAEWLEEHPEYTELEKNFKPQTVTKEVNREAKKLK